MIFSFPPSAHQRAWSVCASTTTTTTNADPYDSAWKQKERQSSIDSLPLVYSTPLSFSEEKIHALSISQLVSQCRSGVTSPAAIMLAFAKKSLGAHKSTNCLSEIMFEESLVIPPVANWGPGIDSTNDCNSERSLMGVPVSIKGTHPLPRISAFLHLTTINDRYGRHQRS